MNGPDAGGGPLFYAGAWKHQLQLKYLVERYGMVLIKLIMVLPRRVARGRDLTLRESLSTTS